MNIGEEYEYWDTTFEQEDFSGEKIASKTFEGCKFLSCNFSEAVLNRCTFIDCEFTKCNLSMLRIQYSKFTDVIIRDSKAIGIDWTKVAWPRLVFSSPIKFYDCMINDSSFYGLSLQDFVLDSCVARNVDFRDGDFSNAQFSHSDLKGSVFYDTNLSGADFSHATDFDIDIFNNNLKKAKFDRFEAIRLLGCLEIELV
ncbi:pentapeptide repeat-containing protein [Pseudoalteromonas sp. Of7M-16]|uniref:pentapeptide repeat-containing protein n=1 Tax=Pseudoalteromonas sp. Of7M-16 TaxID=2917756 RepID=UPI001EF6217A|nr:pentapeptide repeat-containing protein [Pseudoalteromonas sp. Of7M-16]MCG7547549.1 pentapeptide repeat-containing protein [Pseudoalteromonas sp. Of7M-16]